MPKVTVAIPSYNRKEYLKQSIASVLAQTFQDLEIIVFDNHSDQDIAGLVSEFKEPRLHLVTSDVNLGGRGNLYRIFSQPFTSEWLVVFHDDDVMHPEFLERSLKALEAEPNAVLCSTTNVFVKNPEDMEVFELFGNASLKPLVCDTSSDLTRVIIKGFHLCFDSVVYKTKILEDMSPFEKFGKWLDRPYVIHLAGKGKTLVLNEKLVNYRIHPGQDSRDMNWDSLSVTQNLNLYEFYLEKLPKPLNSKDERLFYSFAVNNLIRSLPRFAGNFKEGFEFYNISRNRGLWRWRFLNYKGVIFLGVAILMLLRGSFKKK